MTPKEKAKELIEKFALKFPMISEDDWVQQQAKQCALIAVDEMIIQNGELYLNGINTDYYRMKNSELFELKTEINKL